MEEREHGEPLALRTQCAIQRVTEFLNAWLTSHAVGRQDDCPRIACGRIRDRSADLQSAVLRTLAFCKDVYELAHHESIARNAGMSEAEIDAAKSGGAGAGSEMSDFDRVLMKAAEELLVDRTISTTLTVGLRPIGSGIAPHIFVTHASSYT